VHVKIFAADYWISAAMGQSRVALQVSK